MTKILSRVTLIMVALIIGLVPDTHSTEFAKFRSGKTEHVTNSNLEERIEVNRPIETQEFVEPPTIQHPQYALYGTTIDLDIKNNNEEGVTELYRSRNANDGFQLIATLPHNVEFYRDENLKPRTEFFYKARAKKGNEFSEFSNVFSYTTHSNYYDPELTASLQPDGVGVVLSLKSHTYADVSFEIIRSNEGFDDLIGEIAADSGSTATFVDEGTHPNTTYTYTLNAIFPGPDLGPIYGVASVTIETREPLFKPSIQTSENSIFYTTLRFHVENLNEGSSSEIYRSTNATEGFQLVGTIGLGEEFIDENLKPRTSYYYKARAKRDTQLSEFSDVVELTTQSLFFNPELSAVLLPNGAGVKLTIKDHSYADDSYDILRFDVDEETEELIGSISLPDSGSTGTYVDANALPDKNYIYSLNAHLTDPRLPIQYGVASATITTSSLAPPSLYFTEEPPHTFDCGNEIGMEFMNTNEGSITEIYRSRTPESNFELIYSAVGSGSYKDDSLVSLKTYYYKARAVKGDSVSTFSTVISKQSGYGFYAPEFTLTVLPDQSVEVKVTDHSYLDYSYELYGWNQQDGVGTISTGFQLLDSGSTYTIIDTEVLAGETYTYHINVNLNCDGQPRVGEFVSDPVTIGFTEPVTTAFALIEPNTDQEVGTLSENDTIPASPRFNIRAITGPGAQSVVFYLNGVRYGENQEPYALFGDSQGNYKLGRLKPGYYTLSANAYSDNGAKGKKGSTYTIHFTVINDGNASTDMHGDYNAVNVYPNPVVTASAIEVNGEPNSSLRINIADHFGNFNQTIYKGTLTEEGTFVHAIGDTKLKKGIYVALVTINDKTYSKRFIVE
ncbi:T9SS type A sorting domain-containing protein [Chryseosolibacter indicus]|uniref:T9SS type A sorting domain-containing protein n=1 Tax=Chryseosolibacter indicus TaxID=2782351 RepID=A0ABS5VT45_9BACT|nr:T9SS type A sorting domain-containing protein [Chryseosolibacter indicus]MBT1704605.1 T9SS type A sorting domain-containing protein [Chryseosolibacter indicus]